MALVIEQEAVEPNFNVGSSQCFFHFGKTLRCCQYFQKLALALFYVINNVIGIDTMTYSKQVVISVFGVFALADDYRTVWLNDDRVTSCFQFGKGRTKPCQFFVQDCIGRNFSIWQ